jgi:hypothetical protein
MFKSFGFNGRGTVAPSREQRAATLLQVRCSIVDGAYFTIRVRNLSRYGLGGLCLQKIDICEGQGVAIAFRNVSPISAQVMWFKGDEIGIRFDHPVDLERIAEARAWTGPGFAVDSNHEIAERCYRPGFGK